MKVILNSEQILKDLEDKFLVCPWSTKIHTPFRLYKGTYSLSILAREHNVPFYIAAPSSTFDLNIKSGDQIPIEQRTADEVRFLGDEKITPDGVGIWNPAFDVTEAGDISAIITERGVIEKPTPEKVAEHLK